MRIIIIILLGLSSLAGFAQSESLSVKQAMDLGLKNNAGIIASKFEIDASRAFKKTGADIGKTSVVGMFGQYNSYAQDNNYTISQTIPFTVFGSQASLNRSQEAASVLKAVVAENELSFQIKQVYYQLAFTKARHHLLLQQDTIYEGFLKSASARFKSGEGKLLEQTTAEAQRNEVKNQLRRNDADKTILRTQLMTLLNSETLPEISSEDLTEMEFNELPDSTSDTNPASAFMRQQVEVAKNQKKIESAKFAPDLLLGYFNQTLIRTPNPETGAFSTASNRFTGLQIGLSIPLWFVPHRARIKTAEFNMKATESNYRNYQIGLKGRVLQAIQQYQKSKNSLSYYRTSALPNAELIIKQSQAAFRGGEISYADYLLGVRSAIGIKEGYLQTLNDFNQSIIYIEFLSGTK